MNKFVWVDGPRPKLASEIARYVELLETIEVDEYIIQLQSPRVRRRWKVDRLVEVTKLLQSHGKSVSWLVWGYADDVKIDDQFEYLMELLPLAQPRSIQWDCEEQWDDKKLSDSDVKKSAKHLEAAMGNLLALWPELVFGISAITQWPKAKFTKKVAYALAIKYVTEGYAQIYAFYNKRINSRGKRHWSTKMPVERRLADPILAAWKTLNNVTISVGLAAYMQTWPSPRIYPGWNGPTPKPVEAMRRNYIAIRDAVLLINPTARIGWWAAKHLVDLEEFTDKSSRAKTLINAL